MNEIKHISISIVNIYEFFRIILEVIYIMKESAKNQFSIIYASQTGQAKAIAESLFDLAQSKDFLVKIFCMSKFDKEFRLNELNEPVVFITSTTGDGEQPETATKCWNKLKRLNSKNNPNHLSNLKFALLGLGGQK